MSKEKYIVKAAEEPFKVTAYGESPKDDKGKTLKNPDGSLQKGEVLGTDTCFRHSSDQKGLDAIVKRKSIKKVVEDNDRQDKTDCRNAIASEYYRAEADKNDPEKKIKRDISKTSKKLNDSKRAELNTKLADLLASYDELDKE